MRVCPCETPERPGHHHLAGLHIKTKGWWWLDGWTMFRHAWPPEDEPELCLCRGGQSSAVRGGRLMKNDAPNLLGVGRAAERTQCLDSSTKWEFWKSNPSDASSSSSSSLSCSSSPPLVTPQTESFFDSFPKLSGVRREALTQHCPLCMHRDSRLQPMKRACLGGGSCSEPAVTEAIRETQSGDTEEVVVSTSLFTIFLPPADWSHKQLLVQHVQQIQLDKSSDCFPLQTGDETCGGRDINIQVVVTVELFCCFFLPFFRRRNVSYSAPRRLTQYLTRRTYCASSCGRRRDRCSACE